MTEQSNPPVRKSYKNELLIGASVVLAVAAIAVGVYFWIQSTIPKVVYQPVAACDLLPLSDARQLLGQQTMTSNVSPPVIADTTAISRCGYTDGNKDTNRLVVAAITVRSGINDDGVRRNKADFSANQANPAFVTVDNLGDGAYFDQSSGQLHVLDDGVWMIMSYGPGATPEANKLEDVTALARQILE